MEKIINVAKKRAKLNQLEAQKDRTFKERLRRDYNRENIAIYGEGVIETYPAIIETTRLNHKVDYKKLSTPFDSDITVGDLIYWVEDDSSWLIYNRRTTEDNFFYGEMEEAKYNIKWVDKTSSKVYEQLGVFKRGSASELKDIAYVTTQNVQYVDGSGTLMLPRNEISEKLRRYDKFRINRTVWLVTGFDEETYENIILFSLKESEKNKELDEDDLPNAHLVKTSKIISSLDRKESAEAMKPLSIEIKTILNGKEVADSYDITVHTGDMKYNSENSTIEILSEKEVRFTINSKNTSAKKEYVLNPSLVTEESKTIIRGPSRIRANIFHEYYLETGRLNEVGEVSKVDRWYLLGDENGESKDVIIETKGNKFRIKPKVSGNTVIVAEKDGEKFLKEVAIVSAM